MDQDLVDVYIGNQIRAIRKARGISLQKLGAAIGTTYQQVQKHETGTDRATASRLWKIAAALGVGVEALFPPSPDGKPDRDLIARLERLPPEICRAIGNLAEAIANAERRALAG